MNLTNSRPDGQEVERKCRFCGAYIEPLATAEIGGVTRLFGFKRCSCTESQAYWAKQDEIEAKARAMEEEHKRKELIESAFRKSMMPAKWHSRTFGSYEITTTNEKAFKTAKDYAENFDVKGKDGLLLFGTVGTGKTHLAAAIALSLLNQGRSVVFGTVPTLLAQIRSTYDSDKITEQQVMDKLTGCRLLVVDELGKEKATEWVGQTVYEIINTRYENNKPVVITTNLSLSDIRKKYNAISDAAYGDALVDRIVEICRGVEMKWPSWRKRAVM